jgi:AraC family transcriptional regulator
MDVATIRTVTPLLQTSLLTVGEFRCPPGDAAWHELNTIGARPHIVFPRIPVAIEHDGQAPVLATPNHTMLYNAEQQYRRELRVDAGDDCVFIELPTESLALLANEGGALVDAENRLVVSHAPTDRRTYLLQHLLVRYLRLSQRDPLLAEEAAGTLVVAALAPTLRDARPRRSRTARAHRELAEAAKTELAASICRPVSLQQLAQRLHSSAFHLARVFRAETGFSLHGFRQTLQVRAGLDRLTSDADDLTALALDLGFSSHSHFTERFRKEFGIAPSQARDERHLRGLLEATARG